ncbi:MAG: ABC transporter ATP-binding protein [Bacillota bacterium]
MLLEVKELQVYYDKVKAVKGTSIGISQGELVTIIGSNGAGKTSTLNAISGIVKSITGEIRFMGERIDKLSAPKIAAMGIIQVPEGRRVFPLLTVMENLKMGAFMVRDKAVIKRQLEMVLELFPALKEKLPQKGQSLSGGQQQMLAVGRALMANPKLLILDEPSLGLSPLFTQLVAKQLKEINTAGTSMILVEQNARMAFKMAHRGYVMEVGEVVLSGTSQELEVDEGVKKAYLGA